jgi:predicted RNase H-like HicB family nuclease
MMSNKYPFQIEWSEEDREYMATCPAFPGLSSFGETEEEALREAKIALSGFLETYKANNLPLPEPVLKGRFSGKLQLRLPKSLHHAASRAAECEEVSLNTYIIDSVRTRVSAEQFGRRVLNEIRTTVASVVPAGSERTTNYTRTIVESFEHAVIPDALVKRKKGN